MFSHLQKRFSIKIVLLGPAVTILGQVHQGQSGAGCRDDGVGGDGTFKTVLTILDRLTI